MQTKREINYGKVIDYDGHNGTIKGVDGNNYILNKNDILNQEKLQLDDIVTFDKEYIKNIEIENLYIARFVKKLKKNKKT